jgi:thiamine biosynthesis lipoprotein
MHKLLAQAIVFIVVCLGLLAGLTACKSIEAAPRPAVVKRAQMHMGTLVTVTAVAPTDAQTQEAVAAAFREIHRLEELLSTWIPTSELSRVNDAAGLDAVAVSAETFELLTRSMEIAELTQGSFNIAVGPAVEAWSVTERMNIPAKEELDRLKAIVDPAQIRLDARARTVFLLKRGMRIDVGGIGKGFAADRAAAVMRAAGATAGVVALSGDIKTFGRFPDGARFQFGIRHPRTDGATLATLEMENEAISTAGDYERYFERDGVRYHHILDPATLQPARRCQSVTVIASEGTLADGLDTGIFVMGPERGMALVERLDGVEAVIVDPDGKVLVSSGLKDRLRLHEPPGER